MVKQIRVEGYEAFKEAAESNKDKTVFVLFSGSLGEDGKSWCPDCVTADPVVHGCLSSADEDAVFLYCGVGPRAFWKDQSNVFRTDSALRLKSVPTLMRLGKPQRLEEEKCADKSLVEMLLSDE